MFYGFQPVILLWIDNNIEQRQSSHANSSCDMKIQLWNCIKRLTLPASTPFAKRPERAYRGRTSTGADTEIKKDITARINKSKCICEQRSVHAHKLLLLLAEEQSLTAHYIPSIAASNSDSNESAAAARQWLRLTVN